MAKRYLYSAAVLTMLVAVSLGYSLLIDSPPKSVEIDVAAIEHSREVVLYKFNDLKSTFGFTTEEYGRVEQNGLIYNKNSQIALARDARDALRVTMNGGEIGNIVDVGDVRDSDTGLSLFWSIHRHKETILYKRSYAPDTDDSILVDVPQPQLGFVEVPIVPAHVYIVVIDRVATSGLEESKGETIVIKLLITDHLSERYVRFVWEPI